MLGGRRWVSGTESAPRISHRDRMTMDKSDSPLADCSIHPCSHISSQHEQPGFLQGTSPSFQTLNVEWLQPGPVSSPSLNPCVSKGDLFLFFLFTKFSKSISPVEFFPKVYRSFRFPMSTLGQEVTTYKLTCCSSNSLFLCFSDFSLFEDTSSFLSSLSLTAFFPPNSLTLLLNRS